MIIGRVKTAILADAARAIAAAGANVQIVALVPWPWRWPSKPGPNGNCGVAEHDRGLGRRNRKRTGVFPEPRVHQDAYSGWLRINAVPGGGNQFHCFSDMLRANFVDAGLNGLQPGGAGQKAQLLTDPAVLFLDEPTSGLDAFQSQAVMESLKTLAKEGRLVISVIHQPRSSIYEMFDKLLILSEGKLMYYGEATKAVDYFASVNYPCPESFNPADFFLDLLSPDNRSRESEDETRNRINFLGRKWLEFVSNESYKGEMTDLEEFKTVKMIGSGSNWKKTIRNTMLLFWRSFVEQSRDIGTTMSKIMPAIFFALLIGGLYSNIGDSQKSIMNRKGVLYFVLINQGFISIQSVVAAFPLEKIIVGRERSGRAYSTLSYCIAKVLVELPLNIFPILVYACILSP